MNFVILLPSLEAKTRQPHLRHLNLTYTHHNVMGPRGLSKGYDKECLYKLQGQMMRNGFMVNF